MSVEQVSGSAWAECPNGVESAAKASDVLPIIENGPPARNDPAVIGDDHVMPANRARDVILHHGKIAACPPDKVLTIEVWDLS